MRYLTPVIFLLALVMFSMPATAKSGGGMDSGGTSGLAYRLTSAAELAVQVLGAVKAGDLKSGDPAADKYFDDHRRELLVEAGIVITEIKPAREVFIEIDGKKYFKAMVTLLQSGAPIIVAETMASVDLFELAANLIHEYGHHLGVSQKDDAFLDTLAVAIVKRGVSLMPALRIKAEPCITPTDYMGMMAGTWRGFSITPWRPPVETEITIAANGAYSDRALCERDSKNCGPPFYYGNEGSMPGKVISIEQACGGKAIGTFNLAWQHGATLSEDLRQIELSANGQRLTFEFKYQGKYGPVRFELTRTAP